MMTRYAVFLVPPSTAPPSRMCRPVAIVEAKAEAIIAADSARDASRARNPLLPPHMVGRTKIVRWHYAEPAVMARDLALMPDA